MIWLWLITAYSFAWEEAGVTGIAMLTIFLVFLALTALAIVYHLLACLLGQQRW